MRAGVGCTVQQTLTTEAASVLKHSLSLARRRGHAQVTPLHVAATLLITSSRSSLLKRACLKSQASSYQTASHSFHYSRALELCFSVALNRLPTTPGPLLHGCQPSLSNALIAALKRAQAHQRRGSIEQQQQQHVQHQQQQLLAIKVELEQLILSILDDPSVSRVMKEAGFSSTAVKNNLEEDSCFGSYTNNTSGGGGVFSTPCSPSRIESSLSHTHFLNSSFEQNPILFSPNFKKVSTKNSSDSVKEEDIKLVLEVLLRKKRRNNTVIVGDSVSLTENLVSEIMSKVKNGDVPELKSAHVIKFQFSSVPLRFMRREEVDMNLSDLKRKVDSSLSTGGGVIIYTGDLKWCVEERERGVPNTGYSPVDHLVSEIGSLVFGYGSSSNTRVWLMATADYQTYMRCQMKQPPLEIQWALQAVSVPSGGLGLSLTASRYFFFASSPSISYCFELSELLFEIICRPYLDGYFFYCIPVLCSVHESRMTFTNKEEHDMLTCCAECKSNYEKEAILFKSTSMHISSGNAKGIDNGSSHLPCWLQSPCAERVQKDGLADLKIKWNRLCHNLHQGKHTLSQNMSFSLLNKHNSSEKSYTSYVSTYPWWPNKGRLFPDTNSISFADSSLKPDNGPSSLPRFRRQQSCHIEFSFSDGNHRHQLGEPDLDSLKSREGKEVKITLALGTSLFSDYGKVAELKAENPTQQGDIRNVLQDNVPWQSEVIPSIVQCLVDAKAVKDDTWLLIEGNDLVGKRRLARAIAQSVFGSAELLYSINLREKSDNKLNPCAELVERALKNHEKLVVLVEDIDFSDCHFVTFLSDAFKSGKFGESRIRDGSFGQAIFILTRGDGIHQKPTSSAIQMKLQVNALIPKSETLNVDHKRKAEWDMLNRNKISRINKDEEDSCIVIEHGKSSKKDLSRQSSSNTLDLNIEANEEDDGMEVKATAFSTISSNSTRDELQNPSGFLELIRNRFVFCRPPPEDSLITREMFLSKIKGSFEVVCGGENSNRVYSFAVEEMVLEEVLLGCGSFLNSLFDEWLKDIFQTSLEQTVRSIGGNEDRSVRLCLGGKVESGAEVGFMGSNLPKTIQASYEQ
ncbi:hypothetical protein RJ639_012307 [Escallonia herrerae]|uniref:Clp R domain-containing protein n=1 Tax=Escallonia herrerae TaxID=1293975 RepID=A0AA89AP03_9ASTE|nr:hypothetical protein RJ639_012307 [Escallonia herrerae]